MVGRIGIGAAFEGPFDHVIRLLCCGRVLPAFSSFIVAAWTGAGRGATFSLATAVCCDDEVEFSDLPINDLRNQDGFDVMVFSSVEKSLDPL